jgi:hypothetical protein
LLARLPTDAVTAARVLREASLAEAFDLVASALYAAPFLTEFHARTGPRSTARRTDAWWAIRHSRAGYVARGCRARRIGVAIAARVRLIAPSAPGPAGYALTLSPVGLARVIRRPAGGGSIGGQTCCRKTSGWTGWRRIDQPATSTSLSICAPFALRNCVRSYCTCKFIQNSGSFPK